MIEADAWIILNSIFYIDSPISRSQYYDSVRSSRLNVPEIRLWLDIFRLSVVDWLEYAENPTKENYRQIEDIEEWAFKESFTLSMISDSLFLAFRMDPDLFKLKFRKWLRENKPVPKDTKIYLILEEPFECLEIINVLGEDSENYR